MNALARCWSALAVSALLAACATSSTLQAEIASYGQWPAARTPGTYAFDRLPSQESQLEAQQRLEDAAHPALTAIGFTTAPPGAKPDVLVQLGARITRYETAPWSDPWWWRGGPYWYGRWPGRPFGPYPYPYWYGYGYGYGYGYYTYYDRQVALMLRDANSGAPLYEARASSDSYSNSTATLSAMFKAAMADFPKSGSVPHSVTVPLLP
jgi:hypothetical protein